MDVELVSNEQKAKGLFDYIDTLKKETPLHVLIIEDDLSMRPFWDFILRSVFHDVAVEWTVSMKEAETLLRQSLDERRLYDLIIADVFLSGEGTGIDLWNRFGELAEKFIFVSSEKLEKLRPQISLKLGYPIFMQKPLSVKSCKQILQAVLK